MEPLKPAFRAPIPPRGPAFRGVPCDPQPSEIGTVCADFGLGEIRTGRSDFGLGDDGSDAPAGDVAPSLETVVAQQIPAEYRQRIILGINWSAYGDKPDWWDDRSWQWWGWFAVYAAGAVFDVVVFVAAALGR
jgi:hypothetical protein